MSKSDRGRETGGLTRTVVEREREGDIQSGETERERETDSRKRCR